MNRRAIFAIVRKDLKVAVQNKGVLLPTIIVGLVFFVVLPWVVVLAPSMVSIAGASASDIESLINRMPSSFQQEMAGLTITQQMVIFFLVYMLAPLFLIVPLMVSSSIAADSFVGEKERKTLEALLYTPTTDRELFTAKLISGWLAAVVVGLVGFSLYTISANAAAWSQMQEIFFPTTMWLIMVVWVVPALPGLAMGVMVLISSRAQSFQDATQIGGVVVLPILLLVFSQVAGVLYFNITLVLLLGLGLWLLDGLLIWLGSRSFHRNRLFGT
jgi:ABC-2 type transport system permease protein